MITLGRHSYAGRYRQEYGGEVMVESFTSIANGATFLGKCEHPPKYFPEVATTFNFAERWNANFPTCSGGTILIGNDVWIGEDVLILDGTIIPDGCIIGAGSVVAGTHYRPYGVYIGNPAVLLKFRYPEEVIVKLLNIKWWEWDDETIKMRMDLMKDVNELVKIYG